METYATLRRNSLDGRFCAAPVQSCQPCRGRLATRWNYEAARLPGEVWKHFESPALNKPKMLPMMLVPAFLRFLWHVHIITGFPVVIGLVCDPIKLVSPSGASSHAMIIYHHKISIGRQVAYAIQKYWPPTNWWKKKYHHWNHPLDMSHRVPLLTAQVVVASGCWGHHLGYARDNKHAHWMRPAHPCVS